MAAARTSARTPGASAPGRYVRAARCAQQRPGPHLRRRPPASPCRWRQRRKRRAGFDCRVNRARDQVGARKRARRVVDDDDIGTAANGVEAVSHGVLPPRPSGHDDHGLARTPRSAGTSAARSGGSTTTTSSTRSCSANSLTERRRIDSPPIVSSCFGTPARGAPHGRRRPRWPLPAYQLTHLSVSRPSAYSARRAAVMSRICRILSLETVRGANTTASTALV